MELESAIKEMKKKFILEECMEEKNVFRAHSNLTKKQRSCSLRLRVLGMGATKSSQDLRPVQETHPKRLLMPFGCHFL